jgi:hypothetical protein
MKILTIKRLLAVVALVVFTGALSGCYVAPGYSYVQGNGYAGDVYYGSAPAYGGYYYPYYGGYYPGYYGYGWGCCYGPVVVGGWWGGGYWHGRYYGRGYYGGWHGGYGAAHGYSSGGHYGGGTHH